MKDADPRRCWLWDPLTGNARKRPICRHTWIRGCQGLRGVGRPARGDGVASGGPECSGTRQRGWLCNKVNVPNAPELSLHRGEPTICSLCVPNDVTKVCLQNVRFARANVGRCPPDVRGSEEGNVCGGTTFSRAGQQACNPATLRSCKGIFVFFFFSFGDNIHMRKHPQASRFKVKTSLNSNWGWKPSP